MIELTHTTRVRATTHGPHVRATVWSGPCGQTQAQNGQLTFTVKEWQHFKRHLRNAQLLSPLMAALMTHLNEQRVDLIDDDDVCTICHADADDDHADDCPIVTIDSLTKRITSVLSLAKPHWMVIEEE